ncbi:MAG: MFS transporter [Proteobacteria bacterium]|nr:MFS transporter [Pseudomonadota bacterium]
MVDSKVNKLPFHYGWLIAVTGTFCIVACLGLGRFALGMLLPSMGKSLNMTYSQMGYVGTGNFVGYLIAVFLAGNVIARYGQRLYIFVSLILVGTTMILLSQGSNFYYILFLYILTGIGSGGANVSMMSLVSSWFGKKKRGKAAGIMTIGSGFAIVFSGFFVPFINQAKGENGWRWNWAILGFIVIFIAVFCFIILRNSPQEMGVTPVGFDNSEIKNIDERVNEEVNIYKNPLIYHLGAIYFLFGYTYVIYATFIVTTLVKERNFSESIAGNFWSIVGFLSLLSGPLFGTLSDKLGRKAGFAIVFFFQFMAYILIATGLPGIFLYASIFFYGVVAWSIPTIMAAAVGDYVGRRNSAKAFGFITFIFGIGQIIGPAVAGKLAEKTGSFSSSFYMASVMAFLAILLSLSLKKPAILR